LDGTSLPTEVYERRDVATLEDELVAVLEGSGLGEFDGDEAGPGETALYLYGPDAGALFAGIEPLLRGNPLCRNARVVVRFGGPGAAEKQVRIPAGT